MLIFVLTLLIILVTIYLLHTSLDHTINYQITEIFDKCTQPVDKDGFLESVVRTIPYYKERVTEAHPKLDNFPIVNKQIISSNNEQFINPNVQRMLNSVHTANSGWTDKKEKSIDNLDTGMFLDYAHGLYKGNAIAHISGGSSGAYFYQWYTPQEYIKGLYGFVRCWKNMGWKPQERILLMYFHNANSVKLLEKITPFIRAHVLTYAPTCDMATGDITKKSLDEMFRLINDFKPSLLICFPNITYRFTEFMAKNNLRLDHVPKCMDLSGDFIFSAQYKFIQKHFPRCDIRLSYGSIEFGQIAQQIPGTMYDYEVFDDFADVENGDGNLIVTNYLFTTQPIIRYKTDDIGHVVKDGTRTIIRGLVGKNKYARNKLLDYIEIDNLINGFGIGSGVPNPIINFRLSLSLKKIYITVFECGSDTKESIMDYFGKVYSPMYSIEIRPLDSADFQVVDRYDRKNTPIVEEYVMKQVGTETL